MPRINLNGKNLQQILSRVWRLRSLSRLSRRTKEDIPRPREPVRANLLIRIDLVEAAGVEPASENDRHETSTCVSPSLCSYRPPLEGADERPANPCEFRLRATGGPSGYPAVRRPSRLPREKSPVDGQLKLPAATVSWRLVFVHLINEGVGLGTQSQPQTVPSNPFRPLLSVTVRII